MSCYIITSLHSSTFTSTSTSTSLSTPLSTSFSPFSSSNERNHIENKNSNTENIPETTTHSIFSPYKLVEDSLRLLLQSWNHSTDDEFNRRNDHFDTSCNSEKDLSGGTKNSPLGGSKNGPLGGNYVREVAMIQTAEIILNGIDNLEIMFSNNNDNNYKNNSNNNNNNDNNYKNNNNNNINCNNNNDNNNNNNNNNHNNNNHHNINSDNYDNNQNPNQNQNFNQNHSSYQSIPSKLFLTNKNRYKVLIERVIHKLLNGMVSMHSKVASQCLSVVENNSVLLKYFVTINNDNDEDDYNNKNENSAKIVVLSDELINWKQDRFDKLVEVLRRNRLHWHPNVKNASALLFDILLNYLE